MGWIATNVFNRCPYCGGKLHIERTSPVLKYGCENCQEKSDMLLKKGFSHSEIEKIIKNK